MFAVRRSVRWSRAPSRRRLQGAEQPLQRADVGGLAEVVVEAGGTRALLVLYLAPAGDGDQHGLAVARVQSQPPRDFVAVHSRHADVEQHGIGAKPRHRIERVLPAEFDLVLDAEQLQHHAHGLGRVDVVIDHQHAQANDGAGAAAVSTRAGGGRLLRLARGQRQAHHELRALAEAFAVRRDRAAVHLDQAAHQGQSNAESVLRAVRLATALRKQLEHVRQHFRLDADAAVAHRHHDVVRRRGAR